jgi:hypothetical protein
MWDSVRNVWIQFNKDLEGFLDFMYLDSRKLVTTGMGNLVDSRHVAERLNWYDWRTGQYVSIDEIQAAWDLVKSRTDLSSHGGGAFKNVTTLRITEDEINSLIFSKLDEMEGLLEAAGAVPGSRNLAGRRAARSAQHGVGDGPALDFPRFQDLPVDGAGGRLRPNAGSIPT